MAERLEVVKPDPKYLEYVSEILRQHSQILATNSELLKVLTNPLLIYRQGDCNGQ